MLRALVVLVLLAGAFGVNIERRVDVQSTLNPSWAAESAAHFDTWAGGAGGSANSRCSFCRNFLINKFESCLGSGVHQVNVIGSDGHEHKLLQNNLGFDECDLNAWYDCRRMCTGDTAWCRINSAKMKETCSRYYFDALDRNVAGGKVFEEFGNHAYYRQCAAFFTRAGQWFSVIKAVRALGVAPDAAQAHDLCAQYLDACQEKKAEAFTAKAQMCNPDGSGKSTGAVVAKGEADDATPKDDDELTGDLLDNVVADQESSALGGGSEALFPHDRIDIVTAFMSSREACEAGPAKERTECLRLVDMDSEANVLLDKHGLQGVSSHEFLRKVQAMSHDDQQALFLGLLAQGVIFLRNLSQQAMDLKYHELAGHDLGDKLLVEVVDPVARCGIADIYATNSVVSNMARGWALGAGNAFRKKLSTTSMLAGFKWDDPNTAMTRKAILHYLDIYRPKMSEYRGVSLSAARIDEIYDGFDSGKTAGREAMATLATTLTRIFKTYNQFFYRKLKESSRFCLCYHDREGNGCTPEQCWPRVYEALREGSPSWWSRPPVLDDAQLDEGKGRYPNLFLSPADSRVMAFPSIAAVPFFWIKGDSFTLNTIAPGVRFKSQKKGEDLNSHFAGGSCVIARLAPQDYHRFHTPVSGQVLDSKRHAGMLWSVAPGAVRTPAANNMVYDAHALSSNKRISTKMHSDEFGDVLYVSIGATMVGSVIMTTWEGQQVVAGQEMGYMAHGGSTVAIFTQKPLRFRDQVLANSQLGIETIVQIGEPLAVSTETNTWPSMEKKFTGGK